MAAACRSRRPTASAISNFRSTPSRARRGTDRMKQRTFAPTTAEMLENAGEAAEFPEEARSPLTG